MTTKHYKIKVSPLFEKEFRKLDSGVQKLIAKYIKTNLDGIADPRTKGKALIGDKKGLWSYPIGKYRVIGEIKNREVIILVLNIGHRKEIYHR